MKGLISPKKPSIANAFCVEQVRQAVQQDMMRPASALHYLSELEAVAVEAAQQVEARRAGREALEVNTVCSQFALDAVGVFALGTKLGALQGTGDGKVTS